MNSTGISPQGMSLNSRELIWFGFYFLRVFFLVKVYVTSIQFPKLVLLNNKAHHFSPAGLPLELRLLDLNQTCGIMSGDGCPSTCCYGQKKLFDSYYGGVPQGMADADPCGEGGANKFSAGVLQLQNVHGMMGSPMRLFDDMVLLRDPGEGDGGVSRW